MRYRVATPDDMPTLAKLRLSVREKVLNDPATVTLEQAEAALTTDGRGWIAEEDGKAVGFALARDDGLIWALFVRQRHEGQGIGTALLTLCLSWLMDLGLTRAFLTTFEGTDAEAFYREMGWRETGRADGKVAFETSL